jgi:cbb3-type cytochrome oxidase maturation protein
MMGLAAFLWALRSGQFDDLEGAKWRAISDDNDRLAMSERSPADDV